ncbi:EamA family transporter [Patescibacteria group bacterium]
MGILSGLVSMFSWGVSDFFAAVSSRKFGNFLTYFWMQAVGFIIATVYFLLNLGSFTWEEVPGLFITLTCVATLQVIGYLSFYSGLENGLVSIVSPIGATFGAITAVLSVIFYNEILNNTQIFSVILIIFGIILVSLDISNLKSTRKISLVTGVRQGMQASLGWGISLFLLVKASNVLGWFLPVYIFRFIAILILIGISLLRKNSLKISSPKKDLLVLLPVGLLEITAFFSYSFGVGSEYASIVAPISSSFAIVTILLAYIFLKERLVKTQIFGVLGVIAGIVLLSL